MICDRQPSFRDAKFLFLRHTAKPCPGSHLQPSMYLQLLTFFPSCVLKNDRRLLEGRVNITLTSPGKDVGVIVSTRRMLHVWGPEVSSWCPQIVQVYRGKQSTASLLIYFVLRLCRKISMKSSVSYLLLKRGGKRSCTAFSTQVTHSPLHLSWWRETEAQRKWASLRCKPNIAREKRKPPNPHGKIIFTQENKSKADYKQEKE